MAKGIEGFGRGARSSCVESQDWNYGTRQDFPETGESSFGQEER